MRKSGGFTLVELITVVVILGILLMMVVPTMSETRDGVGKNQANTTHKIFVNAIDYWVKDNINPAQRPANFFSKSTNISKDSGSANGYKLNTPFVDGYRQVEVKFERGVLKTTFMLAEPDGTFSSRGDKASLTYGIYDMDSSGNVKDYNTLVNNKFIVIGNYVELK